MADGTDHLLASAAKSVEAGEAIEGKEKKFQKENEEGEVEEGSQVVIEEHGLGSSIGRDGAFRKSAVHCDSHRCARYRSREPHSRPVHVDF